MHCFNSITVQLRLMKEKETILKSTFQFHNGTIKTLSSTLATCMKARFNSITVQLRQHTVHQEVTKVSCFNSITVQLRLLLLSFLRLKFTSFNSITVQLRHKTRM